ncbi:MAG: helix-turn-helix domain-containing protein [Mycobacterium sp.]|nr:helix-turn-helix domain-containing protein [Mycobacterium sp.]
MSILELLATHGGRLSSAQIADALTLNRSTTGTILMTLTERGWLIRQPDLTYALGPALVPINQSVRETLRLPEDIDDELQQLAHRVGYASGLTAVTSHHLIVIALMGDRRPIPAGVTTGTRMPLDPPAGAVTIAHGDAARQSDWLRRASPETRSELKQTLTRIRADGAGMWGRNANLSVIATIAPLIESVPISPGSVVFNDQLIALYGSLVGSAYDLHELSPEPMPVSLITAPVFNIHGHVQWELQIAPFKQATSLAERRHLLNEIKTTAKQLSHKAGNTDHRD